MNTRTKAKQKMASVLGCNVDVILDDVDLTSLVNSSFLLVEMVIELQEEFDVLFYQADMNQVSTVSQLLDLIDSRLSNGVN